MLLAQMEGQGLVLREADARDARVKRLALTREGQALASRSLKVQSEVIAAMVEGGSDAELDMVAQIMQRVSQRLEVLQQTALQQAAPAVRRVRPASH
jgi:DNA-binding MarR family transcriptional regulator